MRNVVLLLLLLVAGPGPDRANAGAAVEGTVALASSPPPPVNQRYQPKAGAVGEREGSTAVVYLEGTFPPAGTNAVARLQLGQKEFQFQSGLLPVRRGTTVEFPNLDDDFHNVFSYSKPKRFDLGRYRKDERPPSVTFDEPGVVRLYCEIHEHMRATILVLDTPYFVKTGADGRYRLENVPPGKFVLKVWLNEKTTLERAVELKDGETSQEDFRPKK